MYWKHGTYSHTLRRKTYKIDMPVILTVIAGKMLEQIAKQSVDKKLEQNAILKNVQCGSIKRKSCQIYLISFSDE